MQLLIALIVMIPQRNISDLWYDSGIDVQAYATRTGFGIMSRYDIGGANSVLNWSTKAGGIRSKQRRC